MNYARAWRLVGYIEDIIGRPMKMKSREAVFVWARTILAYQLTEEGFSKASVGRFLGKDHSTVVYMRTRMREAMLMPRAYRDVIDIWKQFQKRIQDEIHEGTDQDPLRMGGTLPDGGEGEMGEEPGPGRTACDMGDLHDGDR